MANTNQHALIVPAPSTNAAASNAVPVNAPLHDIKDPIPIASPWMWVWLGVLVLAIVALIYWLKNRKPAPKIDPALLIPPHRRAKERLRAATELLSDPYRFCSLVSDVTRVYLEERFNVRAPERTTEEFLEEQRTSPLLTDAQKDLLSNFLTQCDLVKFARHEPAEPELRALLDAALRLIDETQEAAPPPPPPSALAVPQNA
jgi:hypothetical protein